MEASVLEPLPDTRVIRRRVIGRRTMTALVEDFLKQHARREGDEEAKVGRLSDDQLVHLEDFLASMKGQKAADRASLKRKRLGGASDEEGAPSGDAGRGPATGGRGDERGAEDRPGEKGDKRVKREKKDKKDRKDKKDKKKKKKKRESGGEL